LLPSLVLGFFAGRRPVNLSSFFFAVVAGLVVLLGIGAGTMRMCSRVPEVMRVR
jgi:hypothetical protein